MFANALSGINVATKSIGAISHNISNAASAGFKASTARFADVMSSSSRDTVAKGAVGNGAMMAGAAVNFTQGNLKTTGQALDLAITGQGMFVKFAGAEAVDFAAPGAGDLFFTRNGSFSLDRDNYLVDSGGRFVASVAGSKVQIPSGLETAFETDLYAPPPLEAPAGPLKIYRDAVAAADSPAAQEAALIAAGLGPADFTRDPALGVTSTAGASADLISAAKAQAYSDTNLGPLSAEVRFWTSEYHETLNAYEGLVAREAKEPEPKPAWMATEITRLATTLTTALGARNLMIGTDLGTSIDAIDAQARAAGATEALAVAQAAYDAKVAGLTAQDQQTRGRLTLTAAGAARLGVPAGASLLLDPEGFGRTDMLSGGTLNDLFETEKARLHDALGIGALRNALALWEPAQAAHTEFLRANGAEIDALNLAEFGQAPAQDKIAQLRANVATLAVADVPQRAADLLAEADALEPGRLQYVATQAALADALEDYEAQVAEIDTDAMADGWNLQGHKLTLRAEGALGAKLALAPAEVADTTEGAISFAGGRIWKGLGEVQGFGAVAAEIGRVVKAAQTLTGSMMEVALGFVAPRPLPADPLADPPVAPDPIDPRITREDVNGIFALAGVSMSRLAEEARKGSVEGEAPIDLILRADLVQPTGGTLARTATRLGFDETLEAPPTRDLLSALEVTTDGRIFATYGGGSATAQPEPVAQLAVAFFANPALLTQVGGGDFRRSATSGPPEVRALGEAAGTQIRSGVLEMANVDLTEELVQMLKFQQMFQSASKAMQGDVDSVAKVLEVR